MSHRMGKTLLISALISILLISSQTLFTTSMIIEDPDPLPKEILFRLRSFYSSVNIQSPGGVLQSFINDVDPEGPPEFDFQDAFTGRDNIAQGLADFFAAYPDFTLEDICLAEWGVDLEDGEADVYLLSIAVMGGETIELEMSLFLVRRGNDWLIVDADIGEDGDRETECLESLFGPPVGGVTASTNKLAVAAPYLAILGLIAGLSAVVTVKMKRKD